MDITNGSLSIISRMTISRSKNNHLSLAFSWFFQHGNIHRCWEGTHGDCLLDDEIQQWLYLLYSSSHCFPDLNHIRSFSPVWTGFRGNSLQQPEHGITWRCVCISVISHICFNAQMICNGIPQCSWYITFSIDGTFLNDRCEHVLHGWGEKFFCILHITQWGVILLFHNTILIPQILSCLPG